LLVLVIAESVLLIIDQRRGNRHDSE
jgi:hypothetical protein